MNKRTLIMLFASILLVLYAIAAMAWSNWRSSEQLCAGLHGDAVQVDDEPGTGFVTSSELTAELKPILGDLTTRRLSDISLDSLRRHLEGMDKIESAEVLRLNNNRLSIRVVPMVPVARVWDGNGRSYYVNRDGKRMAATARYHIDVPQLTGNFRGDYSPVTLLPLLDYLNSHPDAARFATMISADDSTDVIIVPPIRGHVINLGDVHNIESKFQRLEKFYSKVLAVRGWEYYDTISLKWDGQVVATRRHGKLPDLSIHIIDELEHDSIDASSLETPFTEEQIKKKNP